jgi:hypothetical protein
MMDDAGQFVQKPGRTEPVSWKMMRLLAETTAV